MTALSTLRRGPVYRGRWASTSAWVFAALLAGAVCSRLAITHYGTIAIEGLIVVPLLFVIAQRPLVAVVVLLVVVSSVFSYGFLPRVNLPGHPPINLGDVCLATAVGGTLWRRPWQTWPTAVRRYSFALSTFLLVAGVATIKTSLLGYVAARGALYQYRNFLYLAAALTVALELRSELWRPFLNAAVGLAAVIAGLSIAAAASHWVASVLAPLSPDNPIVNTQLVGSGSTTSRIRVDGLYFVYAMCIPTLVMILLIKDRWRPLRIAALLLILGGIGVSLNRNMYSGAVVGLLLTALLGGAKLRARVVRVVASVTSLLVLLALASVGTGVVSAIGQRASSGLSPSQMQLAGSWRPLPIGPYLDGDRVTELRFALPAIGRHPWFGVGPLRPYGAFSGVNGKPVVPRINVQNLYIHIATDYGIPSALAFMLIPVFCLVFGVARLSHASNPLDRALLAAAIGTLVALLLSLLVGTYVQDPPSTVAFGVSCGLLLAAALRTYSSSLRSDQSLNVRTS